MICLTLYPVNEANDIRNESKPIKHPTTITNTSSEISNIDLDKLSGRYRAQLINSLSGFKSANLIGSRCRDNQENLAIFSSVVHLGASPALIGFIVRPDTVARHTLENIKATGQYTINHVSNEIWRQAHQTSARYAKNENEFEKAGLTPLYTPKTQAPFVLESRLKYSLSLEQIIPIELNGTLLVIGKVFELLCDRLALKADGYIDIESLNTVALSGLDSYHNTNRLARLSYAKPELPTTELVQEYVAN